MKHFYFKELCAALTLLLMPSVLMALEKDGEIYLISTANDLIEFAKQVNNGEAFDIYGYADAKLTADIDLRGHESEFPLIGTVEHQYKGTFDGQQHTITYNLVSTAESCGLFAHLGGTVRNLYLDGTLRVNHNYAGSIAGTAYFPAIIEQCHSRVKIIADGGDYIGGLVGHATGFEGPPYIRVTNCIYSGHIMGFVFHFAGIVAWANVSTVVKNCLMTAPIDTDVTQMSGHVIADGSRRSTTDNITYAGIVNCYFVYPYGTPEPYGATQVTMEQVESGEVCCLLNWDENIYNAASHLTIFRQNLGEDKFPVFDGTHGLVKEITSTGYASFAPGYVEDGYDHFIVPEGVEAYTGTLSENTLLMHAAGNVIGGGNGNGYVLKGAPGFYSFMPTSEELAKVENDFDGGSGTIDTRYASYYLLDEKDGVVGFYRLKSGEGFDSHLAFLVDPPTDVEMLPLNFDEVNAIQAVQPALQDDGSSIYNLSGLRVKSTTKDIYIINGKKVFGR